MLRNFLKLEWYSFTRAASYKLNVALKIILGLAAIFYSFLILSLGVFVFYALEEEGMEPLAEVNRYLIYWLVLDLVMRYFIQKLPVTWVRPLLGQPISKKTINHYLLGKTAFSFFNFYPLFFFIPFSIVLLINGYSVLGVIAWHVAIFALTYLNNYINLAINNKDWVFIVVAGLLAIFGALQYLDYLDITQYTGPVFQAFYEWAWPTIIVIGALFMVYRFNFKYFYKSLYLDDAIQVKTKSANVQDYSWLERYGLMGTFLKNDLRLILRNKRSKNTLWLSLFFLFYGLLIFTSPGYEADGWLVIAGVMIPSGFLFTFGGYVPSWDSSYYQFMMSQNIKYKEYLASKWWLMVIVTFISMIICAFYLFLGTKYYLAILAGGIYSIGVNGHLTLLAGAFVKTPIDLSSSKKPFGDKQSFNIKTILLALPKIFLPIVIYYFFQYTFDQTVGFISIAAFGILGLVFRNKVFSLIEGIYKQEKYSTIQAYKQK